MRKPADRLGVCSMAFLMVRMTWSCQSFCSRKRPACFVIRECKDLYKLTDKDIFEHIELLRARSDLADPVVHTPVVLTDPNDDPAVYTAVAGRAEVLCTLDRDFYTHQVISFCGERGIEVMNDV